MDVGLDAKDETRVLIVIGQIVSGTRSLSVATRSPIIDSSGNSSITFRRSVCRWRHA
ncbi:hypothetical protein [Sphaerisporangium album]|uniref:hypothetical protein n=1 Tax=Sphaerisporangium album TaxID=509200 RepID=UPI0015F05C46|nr:hypothetical protein [Sphaerisporangium album]